MTKVFRQWGLATNFDEIALSIQRCVSFKSVYPNDRETFDRGDFFEAISGKFIGAMKPPLFEKAIQETGSHFAFAQVNPLPFWLFCALNAWCSTVHSKIFFCKLVEKKVLSTVSIPKLSL